MGGRADYEERRKRRIERYNELSEKAKEKSRTYSNSNANRILEMTPGQPILVGHYSEKKHRKLIEKAHNDIKKSIEMDDKSKFYSNRVESVENSKVIYNDDPNAIEKLKEKLERLENQRNSIKTREHEQWELTNIGANIRETKRRIERLERLETIKFENVKFKNGRVIHNKTINRIQLLFNDIPNEDIRKELKRNGFHWSRYEGAWQREFNENAIRTTNNLIKNVLNKEKIQKQEEEEEFE